MFSDTALCAVTLTLSGTAAASANEMQIEHLDTIPVMHMDQPSQVGKAQYRRRVFKELLSNGKL